MFVLNDMSSPKDCADVCLDEIRWLRRSEIPVNFLTYKLLQAELTLVEKFVCFADVKVSSSRRGAVYLAISVPFSPTAHVPRLKTPQQARQLTFCQVLMRSLK